MGRHVLPLLITLLAVGAAGSQEVYDGDYDSNGNRDGYGVTPPLPPHPRPRDTMRPAAPAPRDATPRPHTTHIQLRPPKVYTWPDGAVYRGTWQANSRHGRGSFRWPSGDHYDGEWANDTQDGEAVFVWADGRTFTGGFKAGSIEGFGRFIRPDGLVYEGDYVSTKREGHGCLLEADSSSYCGEFGHRGKMHGYGVKVRERRRAARRGEAGRGKLALGGAGGGVCTPRPQNYRLGARGRPARRISLRFPSPSVLSTPPPPPPPTCTNDSTSSAGVACGADGEQQDR